MVDFRDRVNRVLKHSMGVFGEPVTVYPKAGGSYKVEGIFDTDYQTIDPGTEQVISANQLALGLNLNDIPIDILVEDEVVIRKIRYKIIDKREDGQGGATFFLHKVRVNDRIADTRAT